MQLAQCFIHSSGALLLESRDAEQLDGRLEPCSAGTSGRQGEGSVLDSRPLDPTGTQMEYQPMAEPVEGPADELGDAHDSDDGCGEDPGWMGDDGGDGWDEDEVHEQAELVGKRGTELLATVGQQLSHSTPL